MRRTYKPNGGCILLRASPPGAPKLCPTPPICVRFGEVSYCPAHFRVLPKAELPKQAEQVLGYRIFYETYFYSHRKSLNGSLEGVQPLNRHKTIKKT